MAHVHQTNVSLKPVRSEFTEVEVESLDSCDWAQLLLLRRKNHSMILPTKTYTRQYTTKKENTP